MHRVLAVVAVLVVMCFCGIASATAIRDGSKFSFEVRGAKVCFTSPAALHSDADCAGLDVSELAKEVPDTKDYHFMAFGIVRDPATGAQVGFVQVMRIEGADVVDDVASAKKFGDGLAKGMKSSLPKEARVSSPTSRLDKVGSLNVVRVTLEVDGLPDTTRRVFEHQENLTVIARGAMYSATISGLRTHAPFLGRVADESAKSIDLAASERPTGKGNAYRLGELFGKALVFGAVFVVIIAIVISNKRTAAKRAAYQQQMYAQQYQQYGQQPHQQPYAPPPPPPYGSQGPPRM